jgi:hypothetical protein
LRAAHLERWLDLLHETLDLGWSGPNVDRAEASARKVAEVHDHQLVGAPPGSTPRAAVDARAHERNAP